MKQIRKWRKPSPSMIVAIAALSVSLVGTAIAGPIAEISLSKGEKKQVRKISNRAANNRITQRAPGLSVASANLAALASAVADNTVGSAQLKDAGVTPDDLADAAVTLAKLADNSVNSAKVVNESLAAVDLAPNSVTSSEIATNAVGATEVASNSIDSDEIVDFGLSNQDVGVEFAQVNANGTLANSSGGVTSSKIGAGTYEVDFGHTISACAYVVTQGEAGIGGAGGAITGVTDRAGNIQATFTTTRNDAGALADSAFQEIVVC